MFEGIVDRFQSLFRGLGGYGKLSEKNIADAMREVRLALLEADVNYKVVKEFIARVKEASLGENVMRSVTPGQQMIKIIHDEMTRLMGTASEPLNLSQMPAVIMLVGLQGAGKTTTAAKIAKFLTKKGRHPTMAACDVKRPAAVEQLKALGKELSIDVFES
ncbi:MAG: signal recognition particle receptor subunit alpha, partial [Thermoplasmata archaeon]|nr:signal recognition particle receptor subunit alpha [Thermoplasmata archaeon]